ncbi:MAG TPA: NINE protein [Verrucomicrobiae bacterium]|nr:NINE protein [Verrucomicrobiae bacterium]
MGSAPKTPDGLNDPKIVLRRLPKGTVIDPRAPSFAEGKSHAAFVALAIVLGGLGMHNWYAGRYWFALAQLLLTTLGFAHGGPIIAWVWAILDVLTVTEDGHGTPFR